MRGDVDSLSDGKPLPADVLSEIIGRTDGVPLFVEELTKSVLQSGLLEETAEGHRLIGTLADLAIPATLQDLLMARLDRLGEAREVAQTGAVIGREFGYGLLADVLEETPSAALDASLDALVRSELVFRLGDGPDATYSFKHALVRDTAYRSMLKSERALRHRQIAAAIERDRTGDAAAKPELLAHHHQRADNAPAALRYWMTAGDRALARSAAREAVAHFRSASGLLDKVRVLEPSAEVELELSRKLGDATTISEGLNSPLALQCHMHTRDLAAALGRPDEHMLASSNIAGCIAMNGRLEEAIEVLDRFGPDELARALPLARASIRTRLGYQRMLRGDLLLAAGHLLAARRDLEAVTPAEWRPTVAGADPMVGLLMFDAQVHLYSGRLGMAEANAREGLRVAEESKQANGRVWARAIVASVLWLKADWPNVLTLCNEGLEIARRHGAHTHAAQVGSRLGAALVAAGKLDEGTRMLREAYLGWTKFGGTGFTTIYAAVAATVLLDAGRREEAEEYLSDGERMQRTTGENIQASALRLLRGRFAELDQVPGAAEEAYHEAVEIAARQGAMLQALRAATALARLCVAQGRPDAARAVLKPIHDSFHEEPGFVDLTHSRLILEAVG